MSKPQAENIIRQGWPMIANLYNQKQLRDELASLGIDLSKATISNIFRKYIKPKSSADGEQFESIKSLSRQSLITFATGILYLIEKQLSLTYDYGKDTFLSLEEKNLAESMVPPLSSSVRIYEEGRLSIQETVKFITSAKHEVIMMGIRLQTLTQYFYSMRDSVFKNHIIKLLSRGVNFRCLMMNPTTKLTHMYFEDLAKVNNYEMVSYHKMPETLNQLTLIKEELNSLNMPGKMSISLYNNFPLGQYIVVDGDDAWGKMIFANYLYGERRANCPLTEVHRQSSKVIYQKHWKSVQLIMSQSIAIEKPDNYQSTLVLDSQS